VRPLPFTSGAAAMCVVGWNAPRASLAQFLTQLQPLFASLEADVFAPETDVRITDIFASIRALE
jgi:hypothetical protein